MIAAALCRKKPSTITISSTAASRIHFDSASATTHSAVAWLMCK